MTCKFMIPSSFQDLERSPYDLLPYPIGFEDDDEATRSNSFDQLVLIIERGNRSLNSDRLALFENPEGEQEFTEWNDEERIQALYTLVRKSSSLSVATRTRLITALCKAVNILCSILASSASTQTTSNSSYIQTQNSGRNIIDNHNLSEKGQPETSLTIVSQTFRDALACHIYMLYTLMFFLESEAKVGKSLGLSTGLSNNKSSSNKNRKENAKKDRERKAEAEKVLASRQACANAMFTAAHAMGVYKSKLWKRGVPDENVIGLPCRIAYQMLENSSGIVARKASSADLALKIIAITVQTSDCLMSTIVSALLDLMHSYEHIAALVAELCAIPPFEDILVVDRCNLAMGKISDSNKLAKELLREIGRLDTSNCTSDTGGKASGLKHVAPFISHLAEKNPHFTFQHIHLVLTHLESDPYMFRSAIVTAIGHVLVRNIISGNENPAENEDFDEDKIQEELKKKNMNFTLTKEKLFDILIKRAHDASSYTRVAVMKSWANLIETDSLPLQRLLPLTELSIDRLKDKTVMVRRSAMQILSLLLEKNPFTHTLSPEPYIEKINELRVFILSNLPENIKLAMDSALDELECMDENTDAKEREKIENAAIETAYSEYESSSPDSKDEDLEEEDSMIYMKIKALKFLSSALAFINLFESATTAFDSMLLSSNSSDVTEALRFFVRARHFQLPCAVTGIKQALALMWSNETNIKDEVLNAFVEVFISTPGSERKKLLPSKVIADNLLFLVGNATVSEVASIEEAMCQLVNNEVIPTDVFLLLWSIVAKTPGDARAAALLTISMGATADPSIVDSSSRLRHLLDAGLGDHTEENRDWKSAKASAIALQKMKINKLDPGSAKFIVLELLTERLCAVAQGDWCDDIHVTDTQRWFGAAEQAIDAIFVICPQPEKICRHIIHNIEGSTFGFSDGTPKSSCHSLRLSRFFFVVSHIALKLLVYAEALTSSVRHANAAKALFKQEQADKAKRSSSNRSSDNDFVSDDDIETELGVTQAEEAEVESKASDIAETEIIGRGVISLFAPLLIRIVANKDGNFSSPTLMQTSMLALCKFMSISSSFCEKHLPLLFTALGRAPSEDVTLRANTVIALGDLAFRFPNEVEPYTPRLYGCLRDKSTRVRRHTLMVLTHLILNDMVKVKGQVCEIALCLQDEEIRIRDMARLLFNELSKRSNNPIYNLLPDIVSRLSHMAMEKDQFRAIMAFLLAFIKKDRQSELLVEKLCHRFPKCTSISQKADIAFCLAQIKVNEKCIKTLNDLLKFYKDALFDEDVLKNFLSIVTKAKKNLKPESKETLDDWEVRLKEYSMAGLENEQANSKAQHARKKAERRKGQKSNARKILISSQSELYESESEIEDNLSGDDETSVISDDQYGIDKENDLTEKLIGKDKESIRKRNGRRSCKNI